MDKNKQDISFAKLCEENKLLVVFSGLFRGVQYCPSFDDTELWNGLLNKLRKNLLLITDNVEKAEGEPGSGQWLTSLGMHVLNIASNDVDAYIMETKTDKDYSYQMYLIIACLFVYYMEVDRLEDESKRIIDTGTLLLFQYSWITKRFPNIEDEETTKKIIFGYTTYFRMLIDLWILIFGIPMKFDIEVIKKEINEEIDLQALFKAFNS